MSARFRQGDEVVITYVLADSMGGSYRLGKVLSVLEGGRDVTVDTAYEIPGFDPQPRVFFDGRWEWESGYKNPDGSMYMNYAAIDPITSKAGYRFQRRRQEDAVRKLMEAPALSTVEQVEAFRAKLSAALDELSLLIEAEAAAS